MNGPRTLREQLMSCMVTLQTAREAAGAANLDDDGSGSDTGSDDGEAPEDGAGVPHLSLILRVLRRSAKTAQLYLVRGGTARKWQHDCTGHRITQCTLRCGSWVARFF